MPLTVLPVSGKVMLLLPGIVGGAAVGWTVTLGRGSGINDEAAVSMRLATTSGWVSMGRCPDLTVEMVACMRSAMNFWPAGRTVSSFSAVGNHDGRFFQAGGPNISPNMVEFTGFWAAYSTRARTGSTPDAKCFRKPSSL